jgi:hypothetical protein
MLLPVNFDYYHNLTENDNFLSAYEEFKRYKNETFSQKKLTYVKATRHRHQKISFLSFDEDGYPLYKWAFINNIALIYSYFTYNSTRYYYVIACIDNTHHIGQGAKYIKSTWSKMMRIYRISIML